MPSRLRTRLLCLVAGLFLAAPRTVEAQTSYPMLMSLKPVAAQVGQSAEHEVFARYDLYGAYDILVTGEGVTGEIVPHEVEDGEKIPTLQSIKIRFNVEPDALPGVRDFRIATPRGVSTLGQLVIVRDAVVVEEEPNNTLEAAQEIPVPSTVCGAIQAAEDVDIFKFQVDAGTALSFHVRSMRLQDRIHDLQQHVDPIIALKNSSGSTLSTSDNYFFGDPFLGYRFEQAGEYFLEIRDVRYQGNQYWEYSIEISDQPFVSNVFPMAVQRGDTAELEMIGFEIPGDGRTSVSIPEDAEPGARWIQLPLADGDLLSNPVPVVVSDLPVIRESDQDNNSPEQAQEISVPSGITGRIEAESDVDYFAFEAKQGEQFSVEVVARREQSALDSIIRIVDENGRQLAENDDLRLFKRTYADSWIENWTAPADGRYFIEIRDLHLRGGADYVYFMKVTKPEPYFELYVDTDKTQLTPGTAGVIHCNVVRKNGFDGEVQLHIDGLPPEVTAHCGRILAGKGRDGCIVLETTEEIPLSVWNVVISGTAEHSAGEDETIPLSAVAVPYQETYQPGGGRGHWPVEMHTVSIGEPNDIRAIHLSTEEVVLKPGESQKIEVTIERAEGFDKNVQLDPLFRHLNATYADTLPEGVTVDAKESQTVLNGTATQGVITLTAAEDAPPVERQQISIMANISINFVMKTTYSSRPIVVTVTEP